MAKTEFLSELDFDTAYRVAKPEFYFPGIIYYHKVEYAEGFVAEEAGIHYNENFDQTQFVQDATHGLAYLPAGEIPEQDEYTARKAPVDGISKEGQIIETAPAEEEKPKAKKHAKKAKPAEEEKPAE